MKDSKKYAKEVQKFFRNAKRKKPGVKKVYYEDVTEALVQAAALECMSESAARSAFRRFDDYFVDFNDMRVARPEEIIEMTGGDSDAVCDAAANIIRALRSIFQKYNNLNLESMKKTGKRQTKTVLEKLEGISGFCIDYCMLTALGGHAIPLTDRMLEYLYKNEMVHADAGKEEIQGFLARQISATNGYEFYLLLRHQSELKGLSRSKRKTAGPTKKTSLPPRDEAADTKTKAAKKKK